MNELFIPWCIHYLKYENVLALKCHNKDFISTLTSIWIKLLWINQCLAFFKKNRLVVIFWAAFVWEREQCSSKKFLQTSAPKGVLVVSLRGIMECDLKTFIPPPPPLPHFTPPLHFCLSSSSHCFSAAGGGPLHAPIGFIGSASLVRDAAVAFDVVLDKDGSAHMNIKRKQFSLQFSLERQHSMRTGTSSSVWAIVVLGYSSPYSVLYFHSQAMCF